MRDSRPTPFPFHTEQTTDSGGDGLDKAFTPQCGVVKQGSLQYITDGRGNVISDGFHEFIPFTVHSGEGETRILLGRLGSTTRILNLSADGSQVVGRSDEFHDICYREDLRALVIRQGALSFILDPSTGAPAHLDGYHSIERRDREYFGTRGAITEPIHLTSPLVAVLPQ